MVAVSAVLAAERCFFSLLLLDMIVSLAVQTQGYFNGEGEKRRERFERGHAYFPANQFSHTMSESESGVIPGISSSKGLVEGVKYSVVTADHEVSLESDMDEPQIEFVSGSGGKKKKHFLGVYTVENAVEAIGFGPFQIIVTIFTGMIWVSMPWSRRGMRDNNQGLATPLN